jgi:hypothetical protein
MREEPQPARLSGALSQVTDLSDGTFAPLAVPRSHAHKALAMSPGIRHKRMALTPARSTRRTREPRDRGSNR